MNRSYLVQQRCLAKLNHSYLVGEVQAVFGSFQVIHGAVLDIHHLSLVRRNTEAQGSAVTNNSQINFHIMFETPTRCEVTFMSVNAPVGCVFIGLSIIHVRPYFALGQGIKLILSD